ncbi:hypothetical protein SAMN06298216_1204 [Spirosomataceae bacterium TFI 002]|nr:hypothetical protein SAMN06298216_1204 [Spirosomataceae bacterium TFI 002]
MKATLIDKLEDVYDYNISDNGRIYATAENIIFSNDGFRYSTESFRLPYCFTNENNDYFQSDFALFSINLETQEVLKVFDIEPKSQFIKFENGKIYFLQNILISTERLVNYKLSCYNLDGNLLKSSELFDASISWIFEKDEFFCQVGHPKKHLIKMINFEKGETIWSLDYKNEKKLDGFSSMTVELYLDSSEVITVLSQKIEGTRSKYNSVLLHINRKTGKTLKVLPWNSTFIKVFDNTLYSKKNPSTILSYDPKSSIINNYELGPVLEANGFDDFIHDFIVDNDLLVIFLRFDLETPIVLISLETLEVKDKIPFHKGAGSLGSFVIINKKLYIRTQDLTLLIYDLEE